MAQISLPDTAVVDLSVLQTIVNAINRHDVWLSQLSSAYSSTPATDDANPDTSTVFDSTFNLSTHEIQFGKYKYESTYVITDGSDAGSNQKRLITFERPFVTPPIVLVGVRAQYNVYATANTTTTDGFYAVVRGPAAHDVWVNWIAIGTRATA